MKRDYNFVTRLEDLEAKPPPGEWAESAACIGVNPDVFFPRPGTPSATAVRICAGCPVKADCLEYGLNEPSGIWGGLNDLQRRKVRQQRRRVA